MELKIALRLLFFGGEAKDAVSFDPKGSSLRRLKEHKTGIRARSQAQYARKGSVT